jgi:hypothetical protein
MKPAVVVNMKICSAMIMPNRTFPFFSHLVLVFVKIEIRSDKDITTSPRPLQISQQHHPMLV